MDFPEAHIKDFLVLWRKVFEGSSERTLIRKAEELRHLALLMSALASDLARMDRAVVSHTREKLEELMLCYCLFLQHALQAGQRQADFKGYREGTQRLNAVDTHLESIKTCLKLWGYDLPQQEEERQSSGLFRFPNVQLIEAFGRTVWEEEIRVRGRDLTSEEVLETLRDTHFYRTVRRENLKVGLPTVVFFCWHHRIVAGSGPAHPFSKPIHGILLETRISRIPENDQAELKQLISQFEKRFGDVLQYLRGDPTFSIKAGFKDNNKWGSQYPKLEDAEYEKIYKYLTEEVKDFSSQQAPMPRDEMPISLNHGHEEASSLRGGGKQLFEAISLCWKCRICYVWNILNPGHFSTVKLVAFPALNCAEDLAHVLCSAKSSS